MIAQFKRVLQNQPSQQYSLKECQDFILYKLEELFPMYESFQELNNIFVSQFKNETRLFKLIEYLCKLVNINFVSREYYELLQSETQKLQLTIRNHIKMSHEMKIYMDHLQLKMYEQKIKTKELLMNQVELQKLKNRQTILDQENNNLKKKNQLLYFEVQKLKKIHYQQQITLINSLTQTENFSFKNKNIFQTESNLVQNQTNYITNHKHHRTDTGNYQISKTHKQIPKNTNSKERRNSQKSDLGSRTKSYTNYSKFNCSVIN